MLDESILRLPKKEDQIAAVRDAIHNAIELGTFTYTDVMVLDEALQTLAFEVLDGVVVSPTNIPQYAATEVLNVGPVRLVSLDVTAEDGTVTVPRMTYSKLYSPRIPGTNQRARPIKKAVDLGTDAMVDDSRDNGRIARRLLLRQGWPIRNIRSRSGSLGTIVEWRWLEKAAAEPGDTEENREIRELLARLKARAPATEAPKTINQPRAKQPAGVSP